MQGYLDLLVAYSIYPEVLIFQFVFYTDYLQSRHKIEIVCLKQINFVYNNDK